MKRSTLRILLIVLVIIAGLALRRYGPGAGLPWAVTKYGGSLLWGTMVLLLVALLAGGQMRWPLVAAAGLIALAVELFRLVHTPWLDSFRLTTTGALLLGRVFSLWNLLAYAAGIAVGIALDRAAGSAIISGQKR